MPRLPAESAPPHTVHASIDQLEGPQAVLDADGVALRIPLTWLPPGVHEGDGVTVTFARGEARPLADSVRERLAKLTKQ